MSNEALNWAWVQPVRNSTRKLVLIALADHANGDGECWPTMRHIAKGSECSQRTVQRHIEQLERDGYVAKLERRTREDGTFGQWAYRLLIPTDKLTGGHERPPDTTDEPTDTQCPPDSDDRRSSVTCPPDSGDADRRTVVSAQNPQENPQGNPQDSRTSRGKPRSDRATRIPDGWVPDKEPQLQAEAEGVSVNLHRELERFRDYWHSKPGKDGRKTDWQATWRNWLRKAIEDKLGTKNASSRPSPPSHQVSVFTESGMVQP